MKYNRYLVLEFQRSRSLFARDLGSYRALLVPCAIVCYIKGEDRCGVKGNSEDVIDAILCLTSRTIVTSGCNPG